MFKSPNTRTELDKMIPVPKSPLTPAAVGGVRGSSSRPHALEPVFNAPDLTDGQLNVFRLVQPAEENRVERTRDDELENQSGSEMGQEVVSGDEEDDHVDANGQKKIKKRRRYHRHTQYQIQAMETFFKECPHPDDKQRKELGVDLGLRPLQIKFWFQNKRTQLKMQQERQENSQLRVDNERLRLENMRYKEALNSAACPACGSPTALGELSFDEHQLRVENSRLRHEVDRITAVAAKYTGKPMLNLTIDSPPLNGQFVGGGEQLYGVGDMFRSIAGPSAPQIDKLMILEFAVVAMEELIGMAQYGEPLWIPNIDTNSCNFVLNEDEYFRTFPKDIGRRQPHFKFEASRAIAVVLMCPNNLADIFMDVRQWSTMFAGIVANATTLEILLPGVGGTSNGALQMMNAEFQVLSPVVPTREMHFVRYCKHHVDGSWAVVDFSPDSLFPSPLAKCRRRPSGCLIQEMPNGYSKVTWIEHVEVEDKPIHNIYRPLVNSGLAFGAKRWICTLDRQCERFASTVAANVLPTDVSISEGRKGLLKVAERMVISFCGGVSASIAHTWTTLSGSGADDVRVMTRKIFNDPGRPSGTVISAATSFWLPSQTKKVFDFLRNEQYRTEWDILSNGGAVDEVAHISNSREMGNCVSLFRVNMLDETQNGMLILQESCCDPTGSFVVYAPVDDHGINMVLSGGNPDNVALLPSGFAILPDGPTTLHSGAGGTLVTVAFQILVDSAPNAKLSIGTVATVNNLITCTVERIKAAMGNPNA